MEVSQWDRTAASGHRRQSQVPLLYTFILGAFHRHKVTHREETGTPNSDIHEVFIHSVGDKESQRKLC